MKDEGYPRLPQLPQESAFLDAMSLTILRRSDGAYIQNKSDGDRIDLVPRYLEWVWGKV